MKVKMPVIEPEIITVPDGEYCWSKGEVRCQYIGFHKNRVYCQKGVGEIVIKDDEHHAKPAQCLSLKKVV